ncbi:PAS domain S-box protein [Candidatus Mcinerneyibacteriota bacterium]|nr:PAS domain S-box protein [Candidatus Mcinerneyibacteriota bacterium]
MSNHLRGKSQHPVLGLSLALTLLSTLYIVLRLNGLGPLTCLWRADLIFILFILIIISANTFILIKWIKGRRRTEEEAGLQGSDGRNHLISIALTGYVFFIVLFWMTYQSELKGLKKIFDRRADLLEVSLQAKVSELWNGLAGVKNFFENSEQISYREFTNFSSHLLSKNPDIHSIVWIAAVRGQELPSLRQKALQEGFDFVLKEKDLTPAKVIQKESVYYPVFFIEPKQGHEGVTGLKTEEFPYRRMVYERALARGSITLVDSTFHPGELKEHAVVSFILPVYKAVNTKELQGFLEGVILMDQVITEIISPKEQFYIGIEVRDPYGLTGSKTVFSRCPAKAREPFVREDSIRAGENEWNVRLAADRMFFKESPLYIPWLVFASGLLVTGLLLLFLRFIRLREENRQYKSEKTRLAILQSIGDAVIGTDIEGRVIEMNRVAEKLTGWAADEAAGKPLEEVFQIINARTGERANNPVEDVLRNGIIVGLANHTILIAKDGSRYQIADSAAPVKDQKGEVIGVVLVFRDVTEEYAVREALEESEELFRTLAVSTPVAVMLYQEDKWVYVNPVSEKITGYSRDELQRMNFWSIVHPDFKELVQGRGRKRQQGEDAPTGYEFKIIRKDGTERWVRLAGTTCVYKGKKAGLISVIDVTDFKLAEEKINEERDKAQAYLDVADVMMLALDREGRVVMVNPKGCRVLERSEEEILGKVWIDEFVPGAYKGETRSLFHDLMADKNKDVRYHENFILTGTGKLRYIAWRNAPLYDEKGEKKGILSSGTDITEKQKMEETLRESEEQFRLFFHSAADGMLIHTPAGKTLQVNDAFCERMGYSREEMLAMGPAQFDAPAYAERVSERIEDLIKEGHLIFETEHITKEGRPVPTEVNARLINFRGEQAILSIARDITRRKATEEALRRREADLRTILNSIGDAVIALDTQGNIQEMNPVGEKILGLSADEARGKPARAVLRFMNEELDGSLLAPDEADRRQKIRLPSASLLRTPDGKERRVSLSIAPIRDEKGVVTGTVVVFRDMTEQYVLEQQLRQSQKLDSIGLLAGGIAHDFNNMLAGIMGSADLLVMKVGKDRDLKRNLNMIVDTARRASALTQKLLDFSRKGKVESTPVNIHLILKDAIQILERSLDRRIEIKMDFKANLSTVIGDPAQLQNAFLNLGINARDALPEGGIVSFTTKDCYLDESFCRESSFDLKPGPFVCVEVRDNGEGMAPEIQEHIFEPFFTTKGVGKGTGLGLAAVYGSVKDHNGMVMCESTPGAGSLFRIYLPAESTPIRKSSREHGDLTVQDKTVLIIEDDHVVRAIASEVLSGLGYRVFEASDGDEGLQAYREKREEIDVILLDMVMPKMNGREVFEELLKLDPHIKVVFSSGFSHDRGFHELMEKGARGFIQKPYRRQELGRALKEALDS